MKYIALPLLYFDMFYHVKFLTKKNHNQYFYNSLILVYPKNIYIFI